MSAQMLHDERPCYLVAVRLTDEEAALLERLTGASDMDGLVQRVLEMTVAMAGDCGDG